MRGAAERSGMPRRLVFIFLIAAAGGAWLAASRGGLSIIGMGPSAAQEQKGSGREGGRSGGSQKVSVEAASAVATTSTTDLRAIGSLQSDETVQIASEIAGRVTQLPFEEGSPVKAGDVLVKLDDALVQAEVADAQARYDLAIGNLGRANTLAKSGNVTERARDEATA